MSQTAKNSKTSRLLAIAAPTLALGGMLAAAVPAQAMISDQFAEDSVHANAVVSEQIGDDGDEDGNCTGTAVADYWVVTARHCLENSETPGGSVRIGQGDDQKAGEGRGLVQSSSWRYRFDSYRGANWFEGIPGDHARNPG